MYAKQTKIKNRSGLHARPASDFIACASKFSSKITIKHIDDEEDVNAKSIVMLLSMGFCQDDEVEIKARGEDEVEAVDALVALIESGFGED